MKHCIYLVFQSKVEMISKNMKGKGRHPQTEVGMSANHENQTCETYILFRLRM